MSQRNSFEMPAPSGARRLKRSSVAPPKMSSAVRSARTVETPTAIVPAERLRKARTASQSATPPSRMRMPAREKFSTIAVPKSPSPASQKIQRFLCRRRSSCPQASTMMAARPKRLAVWLRFGKGPEPALVMPEGKRAVFEIKQKAKRRRARPRRQRRRGTDGGRSDAPAVARPRSKTSTPRRENCRDSRA